MRVGLRMITNDNPLSLQRKRIDSPNRTIPSSDARRAGNLNKIHELIFRGIFSKRDAEKKTKKGYGRKLAQRNTTPSGERLSRVSIPIRSPSRESNAVAGRAKRWKTPESRVGIERTGPTSGPRWPLTLDSIPFCCELSRILARTRSSLDSFWNSNPRRYNTLRRFWFFLFFFKYSNPFL